MLLTIPFGALQILALLADFVRFTLYPSSKLMLEQIRHCNSGQPEGSE